MDDNNSRILSLIEKFERDIATAEEMRELEQWFQSLEGNPDLTDGLSPNEQQKAKDLLFGRIESTIDRLPPGKDRPAIRRLPNWKKLVAAASIMLAASIGALFLWNQQEPKEQAIAELDRDFAPGSSKAVLRLANGERILLDDAQRGDLAREGNTVIRKTDDGSVVYDPGSESRDVLINTLTTPRGGTYHLTLADGTNVWLNAASSITYPSAFVEDAREIEVSGEVYLEVAHNPAKPFRVRTGTQTVEVLGTHFNINAYGGLIRTTLLEGSVAIRAGSAHQRLTPGQQGVLQGNTIRTQQVDVDEIIGWKDGFFDFTDADIRTVMQEFSRWYDLNIVFEGPQTHETFTGRIPRSWSFARVMKLMETFRSTRLTIEGRRVMVRQ